MRPNGAASPAGAVVAPRISVAAGWLLWIAEAGAVMLVLAALVTGGGSRALRGRDFG